MKYVDELSTMTVNAKLTRAPTTLRYRIVDVDNQRIAWDWTDLTPEIEPSFTVPARANAIYRDTRGKRRKAEHRVLVMQANADMEDQFNKEEHYSVRNLLGFES